VLLAGPITCIHVVLAVFFQDKTSVTLIPFDCGFIFYQIHGLFRGGTATVMRETCGNMLFFTTYETTRYHLFTSFGLDPNRAKTPSHTDESASTQSMVANTLFETGIGIITGGLAGVAVSPHGS